MCLWGWPKQDCRFVELWLLHSRRYKEMEASKCRLVPHSSATSASVWAARLVEKFLSFLPFLFSARLVPGSVLERGQGPNYCVNQSSTSDQCCSSLFFFFSAFQKDLKKQNKPKNHLAFYFQAHPVPSQGKKKSTEQHLFIKFLFSSPCLFLAQGSANWFPQSVDQRGR